MTDSNVATERSQSGAAPTSVIGGVTDAYPEQVAPAVGSATNMRVHQYNSFDDYFERNWDKRRERRCTYTRRNTVTLVKNTNNQLEAT